MPHKTANKLWKSTTGTTNTITYSLSLISALTKIAAETQRLTTNCKLTFLIAHARKIYFKQKQKTKLEALGQFACGWEQN